MRIKPTWPLVAAASLLGASAALWILTGTDPAAEHRHGPELASSEVPGHAPQPEVSKVPETPLTEVTHSVEDRQEEAFLWEPPSPAQALATSAGPSVPPGIAGAVAAAEPGPRSSAAPEPTKPSSPARAAPSSVRPEQRRSRVSRGNGREPNRLPDLDELGPNGTRAAAMELISSPEDPEMRRLTHLLQEDPSDVTALNNLAVLYARHPALHVFSEALFGALESLGPGDPVIAGNLAAFEALRSGRAATVSFDRQGGLDVLRVRL